MKTIPFFVLVLFTLSASAQERPAPIVSPEINPDGTVTFRLRAPKAQEVRVWGEWSKGDAMIKDEKGVWSVTLGPIEPDHYGYAFTIDGMRTIDPSNSIVKPARVISTSTLILPATPPAPWDVQPGVPRGTVHLHDYDSQSLGIVRRLRVYTPPNYDTVKDARFPVLYLLHGSGDNEATWTEFGRAHIILDNLIAAKKAQPMIVVMTNGHAVTSNSPELRGKNTAQFERDLFGDVIPLVNEQYRTFTERENHAIIGLSMGGNQSLIAGLNHLDRFAWVGSMSSGVRDPDTQLAPFLQDPTSDIKLRLLWFACGKDDALIKQNQTLDALLTDRKIKHTYRETAGSHSWPVWRRYLTEFAPLLFKSL